MKWDKDWYFTMKICYLSRQFGTVPKNNLIQVPTLESISGNLYVGNASSISDTITAPTKKKSFSPTLLQNK